jgi:hypothetical protein
MSYRRKHRWFRRMALGLAFASVLFAGRASSAAAKVDEGTSTSTSRYVAAGGWSGQVDPETGIPLSAGIPQGDEQFIDDQAVQVVPYLSQGLLTQADADAAAARAVPVAPDGDAVAFENAIESQQPTVIPYLSHGMTIDDVETVAARPDDRADRFAHSDVTQAQPVSNGGSTVEWNDALTFGIGGIVLALALGLALGHVRRPRLAGL